MHFLRSRLDGPVNEWGSGEEGGVGGGGGGEGLKRGSGHNETRRPPLGHANQFFITIIRYL